MKYLFLILLTFISISACTLRADKIYFENLETKIPLTKGEHHEI